MTEILMKSRRYPCPLAVAFHKWEDQCTPMLEFSCFHSLKWDKSPTSSSEIWNDSTISSILFAGSTTGTIIVYKIHSKNGKILDITPLSLLCGHKTALMCIIDCDPFIYSNCIASLSWDGTVSIISVEDLTIVHNQQFLFSENSNYLARHESNQDLLLASQEFGTIEIANVFDGTLILRISGFPSIVKAITSHGSMQAVSCSDGSISLIGVGETDVSYHYYIPSPAEHVNALSLLSPDLTSVLTISPHSFSLICGSSSPYIHKNTGNDSFRHGGWINNRNFYINFISGRVEIYSIPENTMESILDNVNCKEAFLNIDSPNGKSQASTVIINEPKSNQNQPVIPQCTHQFEIASRDFSSPVAATAEGFVVHSPGKSIIEIRSDYGRAVCNLSSYFTSVYKCRCAIGDPVCHEARVGSDNSIYIDDFKVPIGTHKDAFMLYAPPVSSRRFMSFAKDGTIRVWGDCLIAEICDLTEPVIRATYVPERRWVICTARFSFSVIDVTDWSTVCICGPHNAPLVSVRYLGQFRARSEDGKISYWSVDGDLVSEHRLESEKALGERKKETNIKKSASVTVFKGEKEHGPFAKVVTIDIPNCQTFALVLDVAAFVNSYDNFEHLPAATDPSFLGLRLLWMKHIGKPLFGDVPVLSGFDYALGGHNFTVTLPITVRSNRTRLGMAKRHKSAFISEEDVKTKQPRFSNADLDQSLMDKPEQSAPLKSKPSMQQIVFAQRKNKAQSIRNDIAFHISPLITSIHAVAASAAGQCFVSSVSDLELSVLSASAQAVAASYMRDGVQPNIFVLAQYLGSPSIEVRTIVGNIIADIMAHMPSTADVAALINTVEYRFSNWNIILPFILLGCRSRRLPPQMMREAVAHLFPSIVQQEELMNLLSESFSEILPFIESIDGFFESLLKESAEGRLESTRVVAFALIRPLEFFEVVRKFDMRNLVDVFLQRWLQPSPAVVRQLLIRFCGDERDGNYGQLISAIARQIPFVDVCKEYAVCGDDDGAIFIIMRGTGSVVFNERVFTSSVSFVTVSPNGSVFVAQSTGEAAVSWFGKKGDRFIVTQNDKVRESGIPDNSQWGGDTKVTLKEGNRKVYEGFAPGTSFFKRIIH